MATTEDSNDALWNQSVCNKSWIDIVEDEEKEKTPGFRNSPLLRDSTNISHSENKVPLKNEPIEDESARDVTLSCESKEIKIKPSEVLPNFSVSHIRNGEVKENSGKNLSLTNETPKDFLQDDLSLTSHLNGFQLVSPCKVDQKTPTKTPAKSVAHYLSQSDKKDGSASPSQLIKRKLQTDDTKEMSDEMLMPSPSKIRRQATPVKKSPYTPRRKSNTPKQYVQTNFQSYTPKDSLNRKRSRELTPRSSERKQQREVETDPEVLTRRQKQIDYGKNTVGYERYRQLVPKEQRTKMHPKTPPPHLKFSRRAWDGLIKAWRQRLHFWDPPSEGGGNPQCLEADDMSDVSSTDGSLPATPVQDRKRQCAQRTPGGPQPETSRSQPVDDDDDENQGCTPLPLDDEN